MLRSSRLAFALLLSLPSTATAIGFGAGEILVGDKYSDSVLRYDTAGNLLGSLSVPGVGNVRGLAAARNGDILVASSGGTVVRIDRTGAVVDSFVVAGLFGATEAIAIEQGGTILVGQREELPFDGGILRLDADGQLLETFPITRVGGLAVEAGGTIVAGVGFELYFVDRYDADFNLIDRPTSFLGGRAEGLGVTQDGTLVLGFSNLPEGEHEIFLVPPSGGESTGSFDVTSIEVGAVAVPVPEPSTVLLLAAGLAGMAAGRRAIRYVPR